jgi:hypothetical protein
MKKYLLAIMMAVFAVGNVSAVNDDDETPGGWDFELPGLKVTKTHKAKEVKISLSSSFSFGFIGGVSQDKDVNIDMGAAEADLDFSPYKIENIEINKRGDVRKSRIYYLRGLRGKKAKIKELKD